MKDRTELTGEERKKEKSTSPMGEDLKEANAPSGEARGAEESSAEAGGGRASSAEKEEGMSEEELRRLVEESLEKVTVADMVLVMMNQLASVGYLKMGLPEPANRKYRDLEQAILAIDALEAMIKGVEGKIPEEKLRPFRGTLANLQLNYVQQRKAGA